MVVGGGDMEVEEVVVDILLDRRRHMTIRPEVHFSNRPLERVGDLDSGVAR